MLRSSVGRGPGPFTTAPTWKNLNQSEPPAERHRKTAKRGLPEHLGPGRPLSSARGCGRITPRFPKALRLTQRGGPKCNSRNNKTSLLIPEWRCCLDACSGLVLNLENSALTYTAGMQLATADTTITFHRATLDRVLVGETTLDKEIRAGGIRIQGEEPQARGDPGSPGFLRNDAESSPRDTGICSSMAPDRSTGPTPVTRRLFLR